MRFEPRHVLGVLFVLGACDAEPTNDYGKQNLHYPDAATPVDAGDDAGDAGDASSGCKLMPPAMCGPTAIKDMCSTASDASKASVTGEIVLKEGFAPGGGHPAKGTLSVVAVPTLPNGCPADPRALPDTPFVALHCADLTAGNDVSFTIEGLPAGNWIILAGLDVNGNGIDSCDVAGGTFTPVGGAGESVELPSPIVLDQDLSVSLADCNLDCE